MSTENDGGSAFPWVEHNGDGGFYNDHIGMSKRELYALVAMHSIRSDPLFALRHDPDQVADRAFDQADAMLKRSQQP